MSLAYVDTIAPNSGDTVNISGSLFVSRIGSSSSGLCCCNMGLGYYISGCMAVGGMGVAGAASSVSAWHGCSFSVRSFWCADSIFFIGYVGVDSSGCL